MIELKLPELGENIETAEITRVLVAAGDVVKEGQSVLELESEKASFPLPCPTAGRVVKVNVKAGDTVSVGQTVMEIEPGAAPAGDGKQAKPAAKEEPAKPEAAKPEPAKPEPAKAASVKQEPPRPVVQPEPQTQTQTQTQSRTLVAAGPATRRLARELGVNLSEVTGSERGGRITRDDVKAFVKRHLGRPAVSSEPAAPPLPDFSRFGSIKRQPLNKIARTSAQRLSLAWRTIPHVTQHDLADVTELEAARRRFNESRGKAGPKITMTALAIQAAVVALKTYPQFNSSFDSASGELILKAYYHLGLAVDTEQGLLVPVVRDADRKTLVQIAEELTSLAEKARDRALSLKEMEGGTFTISNLGGIGGSFFTPIINYPEVAILGIGRTESRVQPERSPANRLLLPLSLSYDHRVINGADGARFIRKLVDLFEDPFRLLAES
jgi:pyruvate dehydrogenase E2 component (dihydrolipoamide acetyltransferase)